MKEVDLTSFSLGPLWPGTKRFQKAATGLDRYRHVDDVAALVAFVAGPQSSFITGANLTVEGGTDA
jgi:NAD(P)-dependent dehydrogenase (short-subunit alcohol dehydrogenase family)